MVSEKANKYWENYNNSKSRKITNIAKKNIKGIVELAHTLELHEIKLYNELAKMNKEIILIQRDIKYRKPTNDMIMDDLEWEVKKAKTKYKSISGAILIATKKAKRQGVTKENFIYNIEGYRLSTKLQRQLEQYNFRNINNKLKRLVVFTRGQLKNIKLK
jgi:hypothetical protein